MEFSEIKPFVRFVRVQEMNKEKQYPEFLPVDCRLFYVISGESKIKAGDRMFNMKKGDVILINSGCPYYHMVDSEITYIAVNFDYTYHHSDRKIPIPPLDLKKGEKGELIENVKFTDTSGLNTYLYVSNIFSIKKLLINMLEEYSKMLPYYEASCSALMTSVVSAILRKAAEGISSQNKLNLEEIVSYIHDRYNENITNIELAELFHFHPNYINEVFKKKLGKSVHQYVMGIRISNAISMLEAGERSISEIAAATGFYDSCYFSRYFKKITGVSPKHYK